MDEINADIFKKSISLEYFWRCLIYYLGTDTYCEEFNSKIKKNLLKKSIENLIMKGDCFELIDGENL